MEQQHYHPIVHKLAGTKNIDAYIEHLNLFMVGDSAKIEKFSETLSSRYGSTLPVYWYL
mgnify:CR=1 FL=1